MENYRAQVIGLNEKYSARMKALASINSLIEIAERDVCLNKIDTAISHPTHRDAQIDIGSEIVKLNKLTCDLHRRGHKVTKFTHYGGIYMPVLVIETKDGKRWKYVFDVRKQGDTLVHFGTQLAEEEIEFSQWANKMGQLLY